MIFDAVQKTGPVLVSMPHDGYLIPDDIAADMTQAGKESVDTDWHIGPLYEFIQNLDISHVRARYSRYVVDLNRPPDGKALYPGENETGLAPMETFDGRPLYRTPPIRNDVMQRLDKYWRPYHDHIQQELQRIKSLHGYAILWDAHSIRGSVPKFFEGVLPDLNLGTHAGQSCDSRLENEAMNIIQNSAYTHVLNGRFKGGFITRHYGKPKDGIHALQLEINQSTYLEQEWPPKMSLPKTKELQTLLKKILTALSQHKP